jgi:2-dehydropantoate 2-reductase
VTSFTILGAGGIGTAVGVLLEAAGHPVTLVTHAPRDAEEIEAGGAGVTGCVEAQARPRALAGEVIVGPDDVLVLAVKAHQTADALLATAGTPRAAMSLQNGIEKEQPLIDRFGPERVLPSVVQVTATLQGPGRTRCASIATSAISSLESSAGSIAAEVASALTASGMKTLVVTDGAAVEWAKAAQWIPSSLLTAATGLTLDALLQDAGLAKIYVAMARECAEVARAHGIRIAEFPELYAREIVESTVADGVQTLIAIGERMSASELAGYRTAMELDLARGRAPELEPTAGAVRRAAVAAGVACPALETAQAIVRARAGMAAVTERAVCA